MSKLLYINNQLIDLYPNTVLAQTLQAFEIGEPGSVSVPYTNRIRIPKTATNRRVLEFSDDSKSLTGIPYTKHTAKYVENGIEIIRNGIVNLQETDEDFSLSIFSGIGFFDFIKTKKLWDINTSNLNQTWDTFVRETLRNATTGLVTPLLNDGHITFDGTNISNLGVTNKHPWIYYHTVIDKIFSDAGFQKSGAIFSDPVYLNLVMPLKVNYKPEFLEAKRFSASAPGNQVIVNPTGFVNLIFDNVEFNGADNFYDGVDEYRPINTDTSLPWFKLKTFNAQLTITTSGGTVDLVLENTGGGGTHTISNVGTGTHTLTIFNQQVKNGDIVRVKTINSVGNATVTITAGRFYNVLDTGINSNYVYFGFLFEDINQIDFLKEFSVRFNILMIERDGVIICKTMNEILADTANQLDWTNKRSSGKNIVRYAYDGFAQNNFFKYPGDSFTPDLLDDYAQGVFNIPNENISESQEIYNSLFTMTDMATFSNVIFLASLNTNETPILNMGMRLMFIRQSIPSEPDVIYFVSAQSDYKIVYFIDPTQANSMHWQFFIDKYHANFVKRLQKAKSVTRDFRLTDVDIHSFDQLKLVHDNGETFIVTKIKNYISGKATEVELFKVN